MRRCPAVYLAVSAANVLAGPAFTESFESVTPGAFPGSPWRDIAGSAVPSPQAPTGQVIDTVGADGKPTRAFQVFQTHGTGQGIIANIDPATSHRVEADLRVDLHPTPPRFGNWTAAMGFFQEEGPQVDINAEPQGVVYVYREKWYFYGATSPSNSINQALGDAPVTAGVWYRVALEADTLTGTFVVSVHDTQGQQLIHTSIAIPNYTPTLGSYNRVAIFDGEYARPAATAGQFSVDNIRYIPSPAPLALLAIAATRRRR